MKRFIAIAATITCCMGNEMPANASLEKAIHLEKSLELMNYHAALPNQRGACDYATEALITAVDLLDRKAMKNAIAMQRKFECQSIR